MKRKRKIIGYSLLVIIVIGFLVPQNLIMPVQGASKHDFNQESYWYYPWGKSGTHKGVDIFANSGTDIHSSTSGIVLKAGQIGMGGNFVLILGPKWRLHYYAHLKSISTSSLSFVSTHTKIGEVGTSGNAKGKAPHLHYAIATIFPYPWRMDKSVQGYKKMFYLNPIDYL